MKLRDELEQQAIMKMDASVPLGNVVTFTDPSALVIDCTEMECEYGKLHGAISEASRRVYNTTGYSPNVIIIGPEAHAMLEKWIKVPAQSMVDGLVPQKGRIGVYAKRWIVYYDPSLTDRILVGTFSPDNPMENPLVYAPYITLAVTPELRERDLSTSQAVFAVDRIEVTEVNLFARVDIV